MQHFRGQFLATSFQLQILPGLLQFCHFFGMPKKSVAHFNLGHLHFFASFFGKMCKQWNIRASFKLPILRIVAVLSHFYIAQNIFCCTLWNLSQLHCFHFILSFLQMKKNVRNKISRRMFSLRDSSECGSFFATVTISIFTLLSTNFQTTSQM